MKPLRVLVLGCLVCVQAYAAEAQDAETEYKRLVDGCKASPKGVMELAQIMVNTQAPELKPHLATLNPSQYCECRYSRLRTSFGVERITMNLDEQYSLPDDQFAQYAQRQQEVELACIREQLGHPRRDFEVEYQIMVSQCKSRRGPPTVEPNVGERPDLAGRLSTLDVSQYCDCLFGALRNELSLKETVMIMAVVGSTITGEQFIHALERKKAISLQCVEQQLR